MALCQKYQSLTHREKVEFVGKVVHALQNNNAAFEIAENIIAIGEHHGLFKDVVINPSVNNKKY